MNNIKIYTDGACSGNPGMGGWGAILICNAHKKSICGGEVSTTNNRMELIAVIKALNQLKHSSSVTIYSDSAYVVNAFLQGWLESWKKNNWRTSGKKQVLNKDLWLNLLDAIETHKVTFVKVKGHSDNELNNQCDELARAAIEQLRKK